VRKNLQQLGVTAGEKTSELTPCQDNLSCCCWWWCHCLCSEEKCDCDPNQNETEVVSWKASVDQKGRRTAAFKK